MQYNPLGKTDLRVSRLCLGCMTFGEPDRGNHAWTLPEESSRPIIKRALEGGINFFDTANSYSDGSSEEIVGRALRDFARREDVVVATKVFHRVGDLPEGLSRAQILRSIDDSLRRLGMDYVDIRPDMLVILNDNEMSISENVGALNNHLAQLLSGKLYSSLREGGKKVFSGVPPIKELLKRTEEHIKGMVVPGTLFEELGFNYIGPVDGHDVLGLITTLKNMRDLKGPQFLHIMTKKGRGYEPAEKDPITFHAVPKFDPSSGCLPKSSGGLPSYSKIFGDWLCETAAKDNKLMAITPAMREGSGMVEFSRKFPDRYFDVAIAEQHAVTFAAGLAIGGYKPIVAIYSTFLQRAYDQVLHDVAIQKLPVLFAIDRAGIVGADGQTHQGAFDLSYLRCIPEMVIMTPSDENECRQMLYTGYHYNDGPSAVRYPRGNAVGVELTPLEKLPIGKGIVKRRGEKLAILNFGTLMPEAAKVAESLNATLVDMRFVKPLDEALILEMAASHEALVTVEENAIMGGAGSGVNEVLMAHRKPVPVLNIGLPDFFIPQGTQEEMRAELGLDAAGMEAKIKAWLA